MSSSDPWYANHRISEAHFEAQDDPHCTILEDRLLGDRESDAESEGVSPGRFYQIQRNTSDIETASNEP